MAAGDGLISMTPTSIAYSGTSASINADGGVDFSAVTSLSLNGVFTGDYDNYRIVTNYTFSATSNIEMRFRASGSDATGSDYVYQFLRASGTADAGGRVTDTYAPVGTGTSGLMDGSTIFVYGPSLAQPTALTSVNISSRNSARLYNWAVTHSLSTAYDGVTFNSNSPETMTGTVHVFGYEE